MPIFDRLDEYDELIKIKIKLENILKEKLII